MASGTLPTRQPAEKNPAQRRYADFIQKRLEHTRNQVRLADVASGAMVLAAASLVFFLAVAVLDQWVFWHGLGFLARLGLFLLWVGAAGAYTWRALWPPLANRINPVFAAQAIEHCRPTLKNSLINFLLLRSHPQDVAPVVYRAMEHRAAADLLQVPTDNAVDRSRMVHLACILAAVVAVFALYLAFSPKNPLVSAGRVIWPWSSVPVPTRVHIEDVHPGDEVVYTFEHQEITAEVSGLRDGEEVALLVSTADGQVVDDRILMTPVDEAHHYHCVLPQGQEGFQQDTLYRITAGDATTEQYKLEVQIAPTVTIDSMEYDFPPYTRLAPRKVKRQGDIKALEGTKVTLHATANMDVEKAWIDLNCAGFQTVPLKAHGMNVSGQLTLPPYADAAAKSSLTKYQVLFLGANGRKVRRPVQYNVEVERDFGPEITIVEPHQAEAAVAEDGQLRIRVRAFDPDFALRRVTLQAERKGERLVLPVLLDRPQPDEALWKPFDGGYTFIPAKLNLHAGDEVSLWASAEDNKEPRPNVTDTRLSPHTIRIVPPGQNPQQDPSQQPNPGDGQPQPNGEKSDKGRSGDKSGQGKSDAANQGDSANQGNPGEKGGQGESKSGEKSPDGNKPGDPKQGGRKDPGQDGNSGGQDKDKTSAGAQKSGDKGEQNSSDSADQPKQPPVDQETQKADAIKDILDDKQKQDQKQQGSPQPNQSSGDNKPDQQNGGQKGDKQQGGNPQQGGSPQKNDDNNQGNNPSQGSSADKKNQDGNNAEKPDQDGNSGGKPSQSGSQDAGKKPGDQQDGQGKNQTSGGGQQSNGNQPSSGGEKSGGDQHSPGGKGDQKTSSDAKNSGNSPNAGSLSEGKNSPNQQSANNEQSKNSSSQGASGKNGDPKSADAAKDSQSAGGQPKSGSDPASGSKTGKDQSAGGTKSEKNQPGGEQGKNQTAGGSNPPPSANKQNGGQGSGDDKQLAQNGPKPESPKPGGGEGQGSPGGKKPADKSKDSGDSQGGGQDSKAKKQEKQDGGSQSGGNTPKPGQGEQSGSSGSGNKPGNKPGENKGGTADGTPGQKDPGKSGDPSHQDSSGAPSSQMDREKGEQKSGDAHQGLNQKPDKAQSPGNSPHDSNSSGDTGGDRKGGGAGGGGQADKKAGKGAEGTHSPAESGGSASKERGGDATGKAGEDVQASHPTGSSHQQAGKGDGQKKPDANPNETAKDNSQDSAKQQTQNSAESDNSSGGGKSPGQSSQQAGVQGGGAPAGGSQAGDSIKLSPPPPAPDSGPDAANLEFSKKQVDLALEHLKDQMAKQKPELLDRLGWTKEEAQRFIDNMQKLKDAARQPGTEGASSKKAYNEFLKNLDLHPHGTRIEGGRTKTDDVRNVHSAGQAEPPSDWSELYNAYTHGTAGK